jgi:uncharacterized protein (DUF1697 family)
MSRVVADTIAVGLLRGVNVGGNNKIRMEALRAVCESLGFEEPRTLIQSGNVVFRTRQRNLRQLARRLEHALEREHGFRPAVVLRTLAEMRDVRSRNPFAAHPDLDPAKLLVTFLAQRPSASACEKVRAMKIDPEQLRLDGREMFIYFPLGMGRSRLPLAQIEKTLGTIGTGRNWNTVRKLIEIAEQMASGR